MGGRSKQMRQTRTSRCMPLSPLLRLLPPPSSLPREVDTDQFRAKNLLGLNLVAMV